MSKFIVKGGQKLSGSVNVSGSKNATLPIISACLLTSEKCVLSNVPDIADVHSFIQIIKSLGAEALFKDGILTIQAKRISKDRIHDHLARRMRASILLLGSLVARNKEIEIDFPGGCVLGKRTVYPHIYALNRLGVNFSDSNNSLKAKVKTLKGNVIIMPETSVTATENAILASVLAAGKTEIRLAACEPHVQDLCVFLNKMGAKIKGIGTHFLEIDGVENLNGASHSITSDYLEAGTFSIAAVITNSEIIINNVVEKQLDSFWQKLKEVGANFEIKNNKAYFYKWKKLNSLEKLQTAVFPGFATDLQAPFAVLLTQIEGKSMIFETLFEGRLNYLFELEKMGAKINISNPYVAYIDGPTKLKECSIASCDIRAGAAMVLASLIADGVTEITNINYIDRGYERLDQKLNNLGAKIQRVN